MKPNVKNKPLVKAAKEKAAPKPIAQLRPKNLIVSAGLLALALIFFRKGSRLGSLSFLLLLILHNIYPNFVGANWYNVSLLIGAVSSFLHAVGMTLVYLFGTKETQKQTKNS